jgi:hypothetical protein
MTASGPAASASAGPPNLHPAPDRSHRGTATRLLAVPEPGLVVGLEDVEGPGHLRAEHQPREEDHKRGQEGQG